MCCVMNGDLSIVLGCVGVCGVRSVRCVVYVVCEWVVYPESGG